ncbi:hypothetical protein QFC22_006113 [Naganishia vaughanmartiniae]|uniref:Uncharacterized protein n=1 Tax=Naganishia vaughanmartiniae TaxID=1424756 RepID=A0ACC2WN07_9TREE|nr:hypothetical protein QFC22_006113 [Naganishia vaughanmartiniae]
MEPVNGDAMEQRNEAVNDVSRQPEQVDPLADAFNLATAAINDSDSPLDMDHIQLDMRYTLSLYALYQQGTKGDLTDDSGALTANSDINAPKKPGFLDLRGKAQWAAWQQVQGLSKREAQIARRAKLQCTPEDQTTIQRLLARLSALLDATGEGLLAQSEKSSSRSGTPQFELHKQPSPLRAEAMSKSSDGTTSPSVSISGSATESETESDSWLSSRESIDVDDIESKPSTKQERGMAHEIRLQGLNEAIQYGRTAAENEDEISLGGDAWSYSRSQSRRASPLDMFDRSHDVRQPASVKPSGIDHPTAPTQMHYVVQPQNAAQSSLQPTLAPLPSQWQHSSLRELGSLPEPDAGSTQPLDDKHLHQRLYSPITYSTRQIENRYLSPDVNPTLTTPRRHPLGNSLLPQSGQPANSPRVINQNLAESLYAIQVSLTALHERMSALEHVQSLALSDVRPEENPWIALFRGLGILASRDSNGVLRDDGVRRKGWVKRLLLRLLVTARRAIIDISFVLVVICMYKASWSAIRRRMRFGGAMTEEGGRKAIVEFWKGVAAAAGRVGGVWGRS